MTENVILALLAIVVMVLLLGMPFIIFGKGTRAKYAPDLLIDEELRLATSEDVLVLRKMVDDLFFGSVVNDEDRLRIREIISSWQPGTSIEDLMHPLIVELESMPSLNRGKLYEYALEENKNLREIAALHGLDERTAANTRVCRIANACLLANLEEMDF